MTGSGQKRRVAVVTGTRAEYGLLEPVMRAVEEHPLLELQVVVAGAHFLPPAETWREVEAGWGHRLAGEVPMQQSADLGRLNDALALGHGVEGMARVFEQSRPHWVVVLGDRIEALAGALCAATARIALAHLHGGDRAEGVADESIRHAITKLAHVHLPATPTSAERIIRMGERPEAVHVVGSPAIDGLSAALPLEDREFRALGAPDTLLLLHPIGDSDEHEAARAGAVCAALARRRVLWLHPNHDQGRQGIVTACSAAAERHGWSVRDHLARSTFIGLLKKIAGDGGVIVGNSSAGLIECAALGVPAVDVGERQSGRERAGNAVHAAGLAEGDVARALSAALGIDRTGLAHPYGDGRTGPRVAGLLAEIDPSDRALIRKRCTF